MARFKDKSRLLELLAETPVVSFACKKIGLDRTTFYRWYKDDKDFRDAVDDILIVGRNSINDMAEASVIQKINNGDMRANIFWLQHNHPTYRPVRTAYVEPEKHRHQLKPGEHCRVCGYEEPEIKKRSGDNYLDIEKMSNEIYNRLRLAKNKKNSPKEIQKVLGEVLKDNKYEGITEVRWIIDDGSKKDDEDDDVEEN